MKWNLWTNQEVKTTCELPKRIVVKSSLTQSYCQNCFWASRGHCQPRTEKQIWVNPSWQGAVGECWPERTFSIGRAIWERMSYAARRVCRGDRNKKPKELCPGCWCGVTTDKGKKEQEKAHRSCCRSPCRIVEMPPPWECKGSRQVTVALENLIWKTVLWTNTLCCSSSNETEKGTQLGPRKWLSTD